MRINPNSSIRSGYSFEDLQVMKLCLNWLQSPNSLKSIKIQHVPDLSHLGKFYLDDIVVIDNKNHLHLYQLKYKQNPLSDFWTFAVFFQKNGHKQSLLEKWVNSFFALKKGKHFGYFITNGSPDNEINSCLTNNKLDIDRVKELFPNWYKQIVALFSGSKQMKSFFEAFSFHFNNANKENFEKELRTRFNNELYITKAGFDNLLLSISKAGSEKYPSEFLLEDIKKLLEWYNPKPLKQNFDIPIDFELYDDKQHINILEELSDPKGGIKVIIGKPGVGKSTYLSNLYRILQGTHKTTSIRYHYHLNNQDSSYYERLDSQRAEEALKADFLKLPDNMLGDFSHTNLQHITLRQLLSQVAQFHNNAGKSFILIVDGLDHVIRERKSERELKQFLEAILHPQNGLWIVLGTQEMATEYFGNIIYRHAPKDRWVEIKGLKKNAVIKIIAKNEIDLKFPKQEHLKTELYDSIFEKCGGNALHLRYLLNQLMLQKRQVTNSTIKLIPQYKDQIATYYSELWRQIPATGRTFALAIALFDCKFTEKDIYDFGAYLTNDVTRITQGFNSIKHLLRIDITGITIYHNSFLVFINNQQELQQLAIILNKKCRKWLKNTSNQYIKWLLLPQVEYQLGNPKLLLQIDRTWVIKSYLLGRNENQIIRLLNLAREASFKQSDYKKVLFFTAFVNSIENRNYNLHEAIPKIWSLAFKLFGKQQKVYPDIDSLEAYQIKDQIIALGELGTLKHIPQEVYERFDELLNNDDYYDNTDIITSWIDLLVYFKNEKSTLEIRHFISQFGDHRSVEYLGVYIKALLKSGQMDRLIEIFKSKFSIDEQNEIIEILFHYDLEWGTKIGFDFISRSSSKANNFQKSLYFLIKEGVIPKVMPLPNGILFPDKLEYHGSSRYQETVDLYLNTFLSGLTLILKKKEKIITTWQSKQGDRWSILLMNCLFDASRIIGASMIQKEKIAYSDIIAIFDSLRMLDFSEDHEIYELRRTIVPKCIITILEISLYYNKTILSKEIYSLTDVEILKSCKWFYNNSLIKHLLHFDLPPISLSALNTLTLALEEDIELEITPYRDKAEMVANLATINFKCHNIDEAKRLLENAANNIISYGYHKDMTLYYILEAIEICAKAGSTNTEQYLKEIAPYVHHISDLTDGDETGSFMYNLSELYGKYKPTFLYQLYSNAIDEQDYYKAESFFADIISVLKIPDHVNEVLIKTSLDKSSYEVLQRRSIKEPGAQTVLKAIKKKFGEIDYSSPSDANTYKGRKEKRGSYAKYAKVPPRFLQKKINSLRGKEYENLDYIQRQYLRKWILYWFNKQDVSKVEIFQSVKDIIDADPSMIHEDIFQILYPVVLQINQEKAFEYLTWQHANSSLWSSTWIKNLKDSISLWCVAIQDFPDKLQEYFDKSIYRSGIQYDRGREYFFPIPKGIAFLIDRNELSLAEKMVDSCIALLKELTPGTTFPDLSYLTDKSHEDEFTLLLRRFTWINPIVREQAAVGLVTLLTTDTTGKFHKRFLAWLLLQKLESIVLQGLIVLLKSCKTHTSCSLRFLKLNQLLDCLSVKSMSIFIVLEQIFSSFSLILPDSYFDLTYEVSITAASELDRFRRKISHHTQFFLTDLADEIQDESEFDVYNLWALIFEQKRKLIGLRENWYKDKYANTEREYMPGRTTIVGDLLRSSFMKVLDYLYVNGLINRQKLFTLALRFIPIDMSIWDVKISQKPKWWPEFVIKAKDGEQVNLSSQLITPIRDILYPIKGWRVFHLNGSIVPRTNFYDSNLNGRIEILPFAYNLNGTKIPNNETIFQKAQDFGMYFQSMVNTSSIFSLKDLSFYQGSPFPIKEQDMDIFPLLSRTPLYTSNIWQYYRLWNSLKLPIPHLFNTDKIKLDSEGITLVNETDSPIFKSRDFLFGLRDRAFAKIGMPTGRYILVQEQFIEKELSFQNLKLAYICRLEYSFRKYQSDTESETMIVYELLNFSE